jgi:large subunit ribosomal protein L24
VTVKARIRTGDRVEIISGREKGIQGEVHQRQVQAAGRTMSPGIIQFEAPVDISNTMLICPKCGELTRVAFQRDEEGERQRVCKKCRSVVDE